MRKAFIKTLEKLAEKNKNLILLAGDLGYLVFDDFQKKFPNQFLNCGVSEQNIIGIAAGLALEGKQVFVYSIIPFITMRCYEQIRNDVAYHNLNVKIIGVGEGYSYGNQGMTHHSIEDIGIMRVLPNMKVICPGDPVEVEKAVEAISLEKGPAYLRLGKLGEKELHQRPLNFEIGKSICLKEGKDICIVSTGNMLENAIEASKILSEKGIDAEVLSMHTIKPLDKEALQKAAEKFKAIYTLEEHNEIGGLGSAVSEVLSQYHKKTLFKIFGVKDRYHRIAGSQNHFRELESLSPQKVAEEIEKNFKEII